MTSNPLRFRIQTAAGLYSQLTGVLAGFVFAALIMMLSNPPADQPVQAISAPLFALLMVFFSLVVASFLYAVVTGDECTVRPHVLGLFASCIFALAAVEMFLSVVWFFGAYRVGPGVLASTRLLFHGVVLIAAVWCAKIMGDSMMMIRGGVTGLARPSLIGAAPALALPVVGLVLRAVATGAPGVGLFTHVMTAAAALTIALAVLAGVVMDLAEDRLRRIFSAAAGYALMVVVGTLLLFCELSLP